MSRLITFALLLLAAPLYAFSPSGMAAKRSLVELDAATGMDGPLKKYKGAEPRRVTQGQRNQMEDVMIDPDYKLAASVAALCPLIIAYHPCELVITTFHEIPNLANSLAYYENDSLSFIGVAGGLFHLVFASLLWVQTRRVRCVFEKDAFEFYNIKGPQLDFGKGAYLEQKPSNYVSGTRNRWKYDSITNVRCFPSQDWPFIVYFKETETPERQWNRWFAAFDSYGRGQPHFFPGICNVAQFRQELEKRGVLNKPVRTLKDLNQH